ncbi:MAG: GxxExxY protein [Bacteroidales bacterium]
MIENEIPYEVIGEAIDIHKSIGPGLLKSAYENALAYDLKALGFDVRQKVSMHLFTKR